MARRKPKPVMPVHYIFEITGFEPSYMLSVNEREYDRRPWWEHASLEFSTVCRHPSKVAGREATIRLVADREFWAQEAWGRDPDWRPLGVGLLELPPTNGRFYASVPHDSMPMFMTAMAHGLYRYVVLRGPPLVRGKSLSGTLGFRREVDLDDY